MRMPFSRKGFPLACGCNRGEEDDKGSHCTMLSGDLPSGSHISRPRSVDADVDFVTIQMLFASIARICQTGGTGFAPTCLVTVRKHPLHLESCVRLWYSFTCAIASAWS